MCSQCHKRMAVIFVTKMDYARLSKEELIADLKDLPEKELMMVNYERSYKINDNYYSGIYTTSIGTIAVEVDNSKDALKYLVEAIKSRNSVTISDIDYMENYTFVNHGSKERNIKLSFTNTGSVAVFFQFI